MALDPNRPLVNEVGHVRPQFIDETGFNQLVGVGSAFGRWFFVDALNGLDVNVGNFAFPLKTIGMALQYAVGGRGDTIFVTPGTYAENVVVTKDYVSIIGGLPGGYARPDVVPETGVPLTVLGQGVVIRHMRFASTGNVDCVIQTGNGFSYDDCVFDGNSLQTTKCLLRLLPSSTLTGKTASEGIIANCLFRGTASTVGALLFDTGAVPVGVGSTDNRILGNKFTQNTEEDIATAKTGLGGDYSVQNVLIAENYFTDKNKATYIDITTNEDGAAANQSGAVDGNYFATDTMTTTKIKAVGTAFTFAGNYDTVGIFDGSGLD